MWWWHIILLYDTDIESAFYHTWDYLVICAEKGIVLNPDKFQFCRDTINFAGLTITPTGISPSPTLLSAIQDFPTPKDITGARSWFGLVNQISWAYSISPLMQPFRDLVKPNSKFQWDSTLDKLFRQSKHYWYRLLKMEFVHSTLPDQHVCRVIGVKMVLVIYYYRNTVHATLIPHQYAVQMDGNLYMPDHASHQRLKVDTPLLKVKL